MSQTVDEFENIKRCEEELKIKRRKLMNTRDIQEGKEFFEGIFKLLCYKVKYEKANVNIVEAHYCFGNLQSYGFKMHIGLDRFYSAEYENKLKIFVGSMKLSSFILYLKKLADENNVEFMYRDVSIIAGDGEDYGYEFYIRPSTYVKK